MARSKKIEQLPREPTILRVAIDHSNHDQTGPQGADVGECEAELPKSRRMRWCPVAEEASVGGSRTEEAGSGAEQTGVGGNGAEDAKSGEPHGAWGRGRSEVGMAMAMAEIGRAHV